MRGFNHATILSPSFQGVRKERLAQWPPFCDTTTTTTTTSFICMTITKYYSIVKATWHKNDKTAVRGVLPETLGGGMRHTFWNPYPISDQNLWFSLPYFRPDQKFDTQFQTWSPGVRDRLLRHVHGSWRKHWWEMVLLPNDEKVANSSKKTYPIQD